MGRVSAESHSRLILLDALGFATARWRLSFKVWHEIYLWLRKLFRMCLVSVYAVRLLFGLSVYGWIAIAARTDCWSRLAW